MCFAEPAKDISYLPVHHPDSSWLPAVPRSEPLCCASNLTACRNLFGTRAGLAPRHLGKLTAGVALLACSGPSQDGGLDEDFRAFTAKGKTGMDRASGNEATTARPNVS